MFRTGRRFDNEQNEHFYGQNDFYYYGTTNILYWQNENKLFGVIFFEIKLFLQSDVVFDSESNGRNFSSLAPPGGEKKNYFQLFFTK